MRDEQVSQGRGEQAAGDRHHDVRRPAPRAAVDGLDRERGVGGQPAAETGAEQRHLAPVDGSPDQSPTRAARQVHREGAPVEPANPGARRRGSAAPHRPRRRGPRKGRSLVTSGTLDHPPPPEVSPTAPPGEAATSAAARVRRGSSAAACTGCPPSRSVKVSTEAADDGGVPAEIPDAEEGRHPRNPASDRHQRNSSQQCRAAHVDQEHHPRKRSGRHRGRRRWNPPCERAHGTAEAGSTGEKGNLPEVAIGHAGLMWEASRSGTPSRFLGSAHALALELGEVPRLEGHEELQRPQREQVARSRTRGRPRRAGPGCGPSWREW